MIDKHGRRVEHLGDGVYAIHEGYRILLHANHHENPTDVIALDLDVLERLNKFAEEGNGK